MVGYVPVIVFLRFYKSYCSSQDNQNFASLRYLLSIILYLRRNFLLQLPCISCIPLQYPHTGPLLHLANVLQLLCKNFHMLTLLSWTVLSLLSYKPFYSLRKHQVLRIVFRQKPYPYTRIVWSGLLPFSSAVKTLPLNSQTDYHLLDSCTQAISRPCMFQGHLRTMTQLMTLDS